VKLLGRKQVELLIILVLQVSVWRSVDSEIVRLWFDCFLLCSGCISLVCALRAIECSVCTWLMTGLVFGPVTSSWEVRE
jgi:hypothetical protein